MRISDEEITRPWLSNLTRGLVVSLYLLLVPLLYLAIYRGRKIHAMASGEGANTLNCSLLIHQESLRERELGGPRATPSGRKFTLVLGS
jgi:hypothetical protein